MKATTLRWAAALLTMAGVAACSDEPSKSVIRKAVDATLGQRSCFNLADMSRPVSWPLKLVEGVLLGGQATLPPFVGSMEKAATCGWSTSWSSSGGRCCSRTSP